MRIAIFENIMTPGGHEVDFDRILAEELTTLGHEPVFYVPENFRFAMDYGKSVVRLPKAAITYTNVRGVSRLIATVRRELHRQAWYRALFRHAKQGDFDAIIVPTSTYRYLRALKKSPLRHSPVPIVFILHGINPGEAPKFLRAADADVIRYLKVFSMRSLESLADWLKREKVPGITGIDTRQLTKVLREHGVMMGKILFDDEPETFPFSAIFRL